MIRHPSIRIVLAGLAFWLALRCPLADGSESSSGEWETVTVWLMYNLPADEGVANADALMADLQQAQKSELLHVDIVNLQTGHAPSPAGVDPAIGLSLAQQLKGQWPLLRLLDQYATDHQIHIRIRFLVWDRAWRDILEV